MNVNYWMTWERVSVDGNYWVAWERVVVPGRELLDAETVGCGNYWMTWERVFVDGNYWMRELLDAGTIR